MAAKVKHERGAYWLVVHANGKRSKRRFGRTKSDKKRAEKAADEINHRLALGRYEPAAEKGKEPVPFRQFAADWLRREVFLPIEREIASRQPRIDFEDDDGFRQRLWAITDPRLIQEVVAALKARPLFIADGHHRYETALRYRDSQREQAAAGHSAQQHPWDNVLMLCASLEDPGLSVLPTHRVLNVPFPAIDVIREKLHATFALEEFPFTAGDEPEGRRRLLQALRDHGRTGQAFGLAMRGLSRYVLLVLRREGPDAKDRSPRERLDVSVLHTHILSHLPIPTLTEETVVYTKDDDEALNLVLSGSAEAALLLNPTKVTEVRAVASAGERMPHKSTYFFPKPLTGLVMHVMEPDRDPS